MTKPFLFTPILALFLCCSFLSLPANAGGMDDGFMDDTAVLGPVFFGFVRDEKGPNVSKATVTLHPASGPAVTIQANILGVYRSHIAPKTKENEVTMTCEKEGYKQIKLVRRPSTKVGFVETDCLMKKIK